MTAGGEDEGAETVQIRAAVRALCADFPGAYWRAHDRDRTYPTEFVEALTKAGYLAALVPEQYGGSGLGLADAAVILEEVHARAANAAAWAFSRSSIDIERNPPISLTPALPIN